MENLKTISFYVEYQILSHNLAIVHFYHKINHYMDVIKQHWFQLSTILRSKLGKFYNIRSKTRQFSPIKNNSPIKIKSVYIIQT